MFIRFSKLSGTFEFQSSIGPPRPHSVLKILVSIILSDSPMKKGDANHWEKGDHSGATRLTVYTNILVARLIHQHDGSQDGHFNCQSAQKKEKKHVFIRFPSTSVPRWPFQLSISTKKHAFIRFPSTSVPRWSFQLSIKTSVVVKKNMTLSDSPAHRSQDGIFQLSISTEKNAFIRFPNPSEAKEVDPKNMCLSDSPAQEGVFKLSISTKKYAFIRFLNPWEAKMDFQCTTKTCLYQIP